ncbi:MAG: YggS family pyridoxal phosphate-dependent enzyme [Elusimicrobia bacterium]|nr:YggS family pyridoxal phosphate-dependent enzyme [Elusimicrobiota bacterium]
MNSIRENVKKLLSEIPAGVSVVAAAKTRTDDEINQSIDAGIKIIGENYIQEAERVFELVGKKVEWHFIGHLQKNKVKKAVRIFDMIETVDSFELAYEIDKRSRTEGKIMSVLVEINSGREPQKAGVFPEQAENLIREISKFENIRVRGLMTMGPRFGNPEKARPFFKQTKEIFDRIQGLDISNVEMKFLSMGMTNSYRVAIEEGANIVRIGTLIFGERDYDKA